MHNLKPSSKHKNSFEGIPSRPEFACEFANQFSSIFQLLQMHCHVFCNLANSSTILDKTVEKLHTWGAFFLNFVANRFFPPSLPLEAILLGLQKKAGSLCVCRKQLRTGGGFSLRKAVDLEIVLLHQVVRINEITMKSRDSWPKKTTHMQIFRSRHFGENQRK